MWIEKVFGALIDLIMILMAIAPYIAGVTLLYHVLVLIDFTWNKQKSKRRLAKRNIRPFVLNKDV